MEIVFTSGVGWGGGEGRLGPAPQAAEPKGQQNIYFKYKNDILRVSSLKLLSRIRKLIVVCIEFHNLLGVGQCDYSPRGGKKKKSSYATDHQCAEILM